MSKPVDTSKMTRKQREEYEAQQKLKKMCIIVAAAIVLLIAVFAVVYFATREEPAPTPVAQESVDASEHAQENDPIVTITMEDGGEIVLQLYPKAAPNTVANFVELAQSGYYDGLTFHRVVSGFVIQGGDPNGNGTGGPGYSIKGEFASNGFENNLAHTRGIISMARSNAPDSAGSQFFIVHADADSLNGEYAAFGEVISGMDVVDEIAKVTTDSSAKPVNDVVIKSITVDTKGVEYQAEKIGD